MELNPWKNDVAVLLIFFVRDDVFAQTFEAVRQARPRKLLLWQDGARENRPEDIAGIERCRKIAENIDWDCEVHRNYQIKNWGCDPSTFYSHKWAFSIVDKCIILEDDCVPSQSFFPFCKELLDRYEFDTRINRICGMNNVPGFLCSDSYFFSSIGSVWGWATWRRVADLWDENYGFLENDELMKQYFNLYNSNTDKDYFKVCKSHKKEGVPHWETIQTYARKMNNQLSIIPSINLIQNIGLGDNSTHMNVGLNIMPKRIQMSMFRQYDDISFPLSHPRYMFENISYRERLFSITGHGKPLVKIKNRIESILRRIYFENINSLLFALKRRF